VVRIRIVLEAAEGMGTREIAREIIWEVVPVFMASKTTKGDFPTIIEAPAGSEGNLRTDPQIRARGSLR
jgi:hypothetical protein